MGEFVETIFAFAAKGKEGASAVVGDFGNKASSAADAAMNLFGNARVPK